MSASQIPLENILANDDLQSRPARTPDYKAEAEGLVELSEALTSPTDSILQRLAEVAMRLTGAESAGISIAETDDGKEIFRWRGVAGRMRPFFMGTMPRDFSPCGYVLKTKRHHLMANMIDHYGYVSQLGIPLDEVLLVPFSLEGKLVGTIWAAAHSPAKKFDREDLRLLTSLSRFASAAYQVQHAALKEQRVSDALAEREHRLQTMFETSQAFMAVLSGPDFVIENANDQYMRLVGKRDIVGKKALDAVPEIEGQGFIELLENVRATGVPYIGKEVPVQLVPSEGAPVETRYVDFVYQADLGRDRIFAHGNDVTETVLSRLEIEKAKRAIENERENFRNLFKQTPEMVCILSGPEHVFEFVNEAHVKVLGFDATGKSVREAQPESVEVHGILDEVYRTGKTAELHEIPVTVTNRLRYFNLTYSARFDLDGSINGVMILGTEITGEVNRRRELDEARQRYQMLFDNSPIPNWIIDRETLKFVDVNKAAIEHYGYTREEFLSLTAADVRPPEELPYLMEAINTNYAQGATLPRRVRHVKKDGTPIDVEVSVIDLDFNGRAVRIGAIVDVTDNVAAEKEQAELLANLKSARDEAERANRLKSAFLANMSHEIRTPLGAMIGFADLLRDPSISEAERSSFAAILSRNGEQLSYIINDILDLSKVEAGHLTLEYQMASPRRIAEEVISLLNVKAKEKNLLLEYVADESTPELVATDGVRLRQILLNIVGNAVKFTHVGSVTIKSRGSIGKDGRKSVVFDIVDTGIGIPATHQSQLFEMFVQGDGSMTRRFGGTGLGLALSRRLARALGGDVVITDSREGQGSVFSISISDHPLGDGVTTETRKLREAYDVAPNALDGVRVLVVDDAPDNRQLISRYLTKRGAVVDSADNGIDGYKKALAGNFDIVLMDIQMPEMDGYTATQKLRMAGYMKPIIALTAHAMSEVRLKCLNVGCSDHLAKPIDSKELISTIATHVH